MIGISINPHEENLRIKLNIEKIIYLVRYRQIDRLLPCSMFKIILNSRELPPIIDSILQKEEKPLTPQPPIIINLTKYHFKARPPTNRNTNHIKLKPINHKYQISISHIIHDLPANLIIKKYIINNKAISGL